jgi:hypothetical protein
VRLLTGSELDISRDLHEQPDHKDEAAPGKNAVLKFG